MNVKILCTLPNASTLINGIKFVEHELGMLSEEVEDEVAAKFAEIKGYVIHTEEEIAAELAKLTRRKPGRPAKPAPAPVAPTTEKAPTTTETTPSGATTTAPAGDAGAAK